MRVVWAVNASADEPIRVSGYLDVARQTNVPDNPGRARDRHPPHSRRRIKRADLTASTLTKYQMVGPAKTREPRRSHAHD